MPVARLTAHVIGKQSFSALGDVTDDVVARANLRTRWQFECWLVGFITARAGAEKHSICIGFQRKNRHIVITKGAQDSLADLAGKFIQTGDMGDAGYHRCNQRQACFLALLAVFRA